MHWVFAMEYDSGFSFGMGVFETMSVHNGRCVMLDRHMARLLHGLEILDIPTAIDRSSIEEHVSDGNLDGHVLKVEVSEKNVIFSDRVNPYDESMYSRGFVMNISKVRRNESSPLTYIKSLGYGDSIMEKRRSKRNGFDEPLFLNSRGEICEGATSNIFFSRKGRLFTPDVGCGLLPGTVRGFILDDLGAEECTIAVDDMESFDGCFISNSVLGIMPVNSIEDVTFRNRIVAESLRDAYRKAIDDGL